MNPILATRPEQTSSMELFDRVGEFSGRVDALRREGYSIGLVPTMGALHEGHQLLIRRAVQDCDRVVVTIFVNPLQFGDVGDLENYPRSFDHDLKLCQREGAALVFAPPVVEMYPDGQENVLTAVSVSALTESWEGASRPGHFTGVATVVAKLFAMTGRCQAYFGEKDFQQLAVIRRMALDLSFPIEVVACATVRQADGLALSSRNRRLDPDERAAARTLYSALTVGRDLVAAGEPDPRRVATAMETVLDSERLVQRDYAAVVDPDDLRVPDGLDGSREWRLLVAAQVGPVRLIDNMRAGTPDVRPPGSHLTANSATTNPQESMGPRRVPDSEITRKGAQ